VLDRCADEGIAAGYGLGREYPEYEDGLLVAITERRSKEDIDRLADALARAIDAESGAFQTHTVQKAPSAEVGA
jgi:glycine dehydrogenase subunit 1